jgi:hypothetical protein
MSYVFRVKGAPSPLNAGLQGILESREVPEGRVGWGATRKRRKGATRKGAGEYVSGLADYSGDPGAFCATRHEAEEKLKRKGLAFERT